MNLVIRPRARDDIIRQFRWYLVQQGAADGKRDLGRVLKQESADDDAL